MVAGDQKSVIFELTTLNFDDVTISNEFNLKNAVIQKM